MIWCTLAVVENIAGIQLGVASEAVTFNCRVWRCEDWTSEMWTTAHGRCQVSLTEYRTVCCWMKQLHCSEMMWFVNVFSGCVLEFWWQCAAVCHSQRTGHLHDLVWWRQHVGRWRKHGKYCCSSQGSVGDTHHWPHTHRSTAWRLVQRTVSELDGCRLLLCIVNTFHIYVKYI